MLDGGRASPLLGGLVGRLRPSWRAAARRVVEALAGAPARFARGVQNAARVWRRTADRAPTRGTAVTRTSRASGGSAGTMQEETVEETQIMESASETALVGAIVEESVVAESSQAGETAAEAEERAAVGECQERRGDIEELLDEVEARGEDGEAADGEDADAAASDGDEDLATLSERLDGILESLLLAAGAPLTVRRMVEVIRGTNSKEVRAALARLTEQYAGPQRGVHLIEVAGGWQFRTAPQNVHYVRVLLREKPARLGRAALETLSIVAYKQPATRGEIEAIRGVDADSALNTLLQKKLIKIAGRKEVVGRPLLYATTPEFLEIFGLKDLRELPTLKEIGPVAEPEDETDIEDEQLEEVAAEDAGEDAGVDESDAVVEADGDTVNGVAAQGPGDKEDDAEDDEDEEDEDDLDDDEDAEPDEDEEGDFEDEDDDDFDDDDEDDDDEDDEED